MELSLPVTYLVSKVVISAAHEGKNKVSWQQIFTGLEPPPQYWPSDTHALI